MGMRFCHLPVDKPWSQDIDSKGDCGKVQKRKVKQLWPVASHSNTAINKTAPIYLGVWKRHLGDNFNLSKALSRSQTK